MKIGLTEARIQVSFCELCVYVGWVLLLIFEAEETSKILYSLFSNFFKIKPILHCVPTYIKPQFYGLAL